MKNTVIFEFWWNGNSKKDIEAPKDITCEELMVALNEGIGLGLDIDDKNSYTFNCLDQKKILMGERTLEEFGLLDGSIVKLE